MRLVLYSLILTTALIPKSAVDAAEFGKRIILQPRQGRMGCSARVPVLDNQVFAFVD
jgi:hypothetical protein